MSRTRLVLVGGFLGAGKTTLLWQAASRLLSRGKKVGLVTNDQAPDLVDTGFLSCEGFSAREVAGSCFCCNFHGLIQAMKEVQDETDAEVVIAEPVGSCADISATLLQPLKASYGDEFSVAPFSVLADPFRLREVLTGDTATGHENVTYILRKQLEEADIIGLNKADELTSSDRKEIRGLVEERFPDRELRWLSALQGQGVGEWLDYVLEGPSGGQRVLDIDYDKYAEGEAVLGWLNGVLRLDEAGTRVDWPGFCRRFLNETQTRLRKRDAMVGHVKVLLSTPDGYCVGNLTGLEHDVSVQDAMEDVCSSATVTVNARVAMSPSELEEVVREAVDLAAGEKTTWTVQDINTLRPGRPEPTYRYERPT